ncbi:hypothetical protein [Rhizobium aegyptiacum]|uniref:hypothetical protein n=1 Tax=Rhizobium aegyptiacum TaxID=1764550 RepID=UPI000A793079|nr:hypothetical protein [Rhizobium aegyptiacum]
MNPQQWKTTCDQVADAMLVHTRPFVTPLGTEDDRNVRLVGTGTYVAHENRRFLLTCEHVAHVQPMHYRLYGNDDVFEHQGPWIMERHPVDAAFAPISAPAWAACSHQAQSVPYERFAQLHAPIERAEILFFRGFSGENARYAFGVHQTNGSGYATQEKDNTGDAGIFELFWEPKKTRFTSRTTPEATAEMKFEDAGGFSGSLVWNTRYLEVTRQGGQWTPADAVVTGLLQRWDTATKTLLAWRVEHLRAWLEAKGA